MSCPEASGEDLDLEGEVLVILYGATVFNAKASVVGRVPLMAEVSYVRHARCGI